MAHHNVKDQAHQSMTSETTETQKPNIVSLHNQAMHAPEALKMS